MEEGLGDGNEFEEENEGGEAMEDAYGGSPGLSASSLAPSGGNGADAQAAAVAQTQAAQQLTINNLTAQLQTLMAALPQLAQQAQQQGQTQQPTQQQAPNPLARWMTPTQQPPHPQQLQTAVAEAVPGGDVF